MEVHNTLPTYPRPITTSYVPSPPPIPTAEYPQYHPPERLEPVHWSTYKHCSSTNESHLSPISTNPIDVQVSIHFIVDFDGYILVKCIEYILDNIHIKQKQFMSFSSNFIQSNYFQL